MKRPPDSLPSHPPSWYEARIPKTIKITGEHLDPDRLISRADTEKAAIRDLAGQAVRQAVRELPPIQQQVLELRYGLNRQLNTTSPAINPVSGLTTYESIGTKMGLDWQRIRQLEIKALRRLRQQKNSQTLRDSLP